MSLAVHIVEQRKIVLLMGNESLDELIDFGDPSGGLDLLKGFLVCSNLFLGDLYTTTN